MRNLITAKNAVLEDINLSVAEFQVAVLAVEIMCCLVKAKRKAVPLRNSSGKGRGSIAPTHS
jgi:hypothetical protein